MRRTRIAAMVGSLLLGGGAIAIGGQPVFAFTDAGKIEKTEILPPSERSSGADSAGRQVVSARADRGLFEWLGLVGNLIVASLTLPLAGFALAQVLVAKDTARRQLRAYIHVEKVELLWDENDRPKLGVHIQNTGQTPATGFQIRVRIQNDQGVDSREYVLPEDGELGFATWQGLGAGCTRENGVWPHNPENLRFADFAANSGAFCVLGRIFYKDIFGKSWQTEFAAFTRPDRPSRRENLPFAGTNLIAYGPISNRRYTAMSRFVS